MTKRRERLAYARVLVDVSLTEPLAQSISFINEHDVCINQPVEYEWIPSFCSCCKVYGHLLSDCRHGDGHITRRWVRRIDRLS